MWNKIILNGTWYLTTFLFKTLTRLKHLMVVIYQNVCYWRFPVHFCPFALFSCKILIHFFSLSWAIENILGPGGLFKPSNISLMEYTVKLCYWFGNKCGVKSFWSLVEFNEREPTNKIQQDEGKWYFLKAQFWIPLSGADSIILRVLGLNRVTESNWLHLSGSNPSPHPLLRIQRRKCPWMKHGSQTWLAAREDTRSAGIVFCITDDFCCVGGWVVCLGGNFIIWVSEKMTCCCILTSLILGCLVENQVKTMNIVPPLCSI